MSKFYKFLTISISAHLISLLLLFYAVFLNGDIGYFIYSLLWICVSLYLKHHKPVYKPSYSVIIINDIIVHSVLIFKCYPFVLLLFEIHFFLMTVISYVASYFICPAMRDLRKLEQTRRGQQLCLKQGKNLDF